MSPTSTRKRIALIFASAVLVAVGSVGGAAALSGREDDARDRPIPATELERAEKAALDETGGGTVTGTEVDDEESRYEIEVTLDDGIQVDVQLDEDFQVIGNELDGNEDESADADD